VLVPPTDALDVRVLALLPLSREVARHRRRHGRRLLATVQHQAPPAAATCERRRPRLPLPGAVRGGRLWLEHEGGVLLVPARQQQRPVALSR
jgi:hypothetical protein